MLRQYRARVASIQQGNNSQSRHAGPRDHGHWKRSFPGHTRWQRSQNASQEQYVCESHWDRDPISVHSTGTSVGFTHRPALLEDGSSGTQQHQFLYMLCVGQRCSDTWRVREWDIWQRQKQATASDLPPVSLRETIARTARIAFSYNLRPFAGARVHGGWRRTAHGRVGGP